MISYALKRIIRSWKLFAALLLGMTLATTFFGGINVAADTIGKQFVDQQLSTSPIDFTLNPNGPLPSITSINNVRSKLVALDGISHVEAQGTLNDVRNFTLPQVRALEDSSLAWSHITPNIKLAGAKALEVENGKYAVGQKLNYTIFGNPPSQNYNITLEIVGIVHPDAYAQSLLGLGFGFRGPTPLGGSGGSSTVPYYQNMLIISWERTFVPALQLASVISNPSGISSYIDVFLDRDRLITPWDVSGSATTVKGISDKVANIASQNGFVENDLITYQLQGLGQSIFFLRVPFLIFSIPVIFIAWYVGKTVSQASYNLRRKEIGLLMTKGFSRTQLYRHFVTEAVLIGLISGAIGLALAFLLNPFFISVLNAGYNGGVFLNPTTAAMTVIFALFLTLLSIRSPASQAAGMDPAQALREYVYLEDVRPSKKRGAIVAFSLGLYKIILLTLGINFLVLGGRGIAYGFLIGIFFAVLAILDLGLTFVGPFLFLYGAVNLSSGLAFRFHRFFSRISQRFIGDIATLASKSVFRNPRRAASTVFLVALIAGYSIWVIGDLASMEDYSIRQSSTRVGADVRISNLSSLGNATTLVRQIIGWTNVTRATPEVENWFNTPSQGVQMRIRAVDPIFWPNTAYYEDGWFSPSPRTLFEIMKGDNSTIILERAVATHYDIKEGGNVSIPVSSGTLVNLRVIGFFGPDYSSSSSPFTSPFGSSFFQPLGWSYVPLGIVGLHPTFFAAPQYSVLVKAKNTSTDKLASSIQAAYPLTSVQSSSPTSTSQNGANSIFTGLLNVLRLGTIFAAAAAGIGVGTVAYTGFKEREKETTMISVRGLSYRQLLGLLITEILPLVIFALALAAVVGIITVRGDTLALDSFSNQDFYALLSPRRITFPAAEQMILGSIIGLLLLGVFLPAIFSARKNLSKVSRTVRFA
jgi:ABC-type antimicrobial peptide transport system permease subunit